MHQAAPQKPQPRARVVLFTGHMLDSLTRPPDKARFPRTLEAEKIARRLIEEALRNEMSEEDGVSLGIAGGACGSDILFHEVCESLGIPTHLYLAVPEAEFQVESVNRGGAVWVERYRKICRHLPMRVLAEAKELPRWLADKKDYDIWQRNNLWMIPHACNASPASHADRFLQPRTRSRWSWGHRASSQGCLQLGIQDRGTGCAGTAEEKLKGGGLRVHAIGGFYREAE
jgi:hypothetical protein